MDLGSHPTTTSLERQNEAKYEAEKRQKSQSMTATAATTVLATVLNRFKSLDAIRPHASLCAELCVASLDAELSKDRRRQGLKAVVPLALGRAALPLRGADRLGGQAAQVASRHPSRVREERLPAARRDRRRAARPPGALVGPL